MKVIVVANADGPIGHCSAKCYDAPKGSRCRCVCGGDNHGQGEAFALAHTAKIARRYPNTTIYIDPRADQLNLWDKDELPKFSPPRNAGR